MGRSTRAALGIAGTILLAASAIQVVRLQCVWGTFAYEVPIENPVNQDDGRQDAAVLVEGHQRIVTHDHWVDDVDLSPDGSQIVVSKWRGSIGDEDGESRSTGLFVYDVDGSGSRRLTSRGGHPDWSPDGQTIAFVDGGAIKTVDVDGGEVRELYRLPPSNEIDPDYLFEVAWSPDASRIAFPVGKQAGPRGGSVLWTMRPDGSDLRRVARVEGETRHLAWSPDGELFAWSGMYEGVFSAVTMPVDGGGLTQIEPNSRSPVWSRDGERLAYVIGHEGHYRPRIVVGDATGAGEVAVPTDAEPYDYLDLAGWASC